MLYELVFSMWKVLFSLWKSIKIYRIYWSNSFGCSLQISFLLMTGKQLPLALLRDSYNCPMNSDNRQLQSHTEVLWDSTALNSFCPAHLFWISPVIGANEAP